MSLKDLLNIREIRFHDLCPDGTASAIICKLAYDIVGIKPKFIPVRYGSSDFENVIAGPDQLYIDITPPVKRWEEWKNHNPIVLDHHSKVAKEVTMNLSGVWGDTNDSGASLAYKHVFLPIVGNNIGFEWLEDFSNLAMIRDTWKKNDINWNRACAQASGLKLFGSKRFLDMEEIHEHDIEEIMFVGGLIHDKELDKCRSVCKSTPTKRIYTKNGHINYAIFNAGDEGVSDAANALIENNEVDVAIGYFYRFEDGEMVAQCSIRTNDKVSASDMAFSFGGGGHPRAAGFILRHADEVSPYTISMMITKYLLT